MADYIKRTLALDVINHANDCDCFKNYNGYSMAFDMIDDMPRADVQKVKYGKWEQVDDTKCRCSSCKKVFLIAVYPNGGDKNYCPNCGAKMDLEE